MLTCVTTTVLLVCLTDYVDSIAQDAVAKLYRCAAIGCNCQFNVVTPPGLRFG